MRVDDFVEEERAALPQQFEHLGGGARRGWCRRLGVGARTASSSVASRLGAQRERESA